MTTTLAPEVEEFLSWLRERYETDEGQGQDFRVSDLIERGHKASTQQLAGWLRTLERAKQVEYITNDRQVRNRRNLDTYVPIKAYYWLVGESEVWNGKGHVTVRS